METRAKEILVLVDLSETSGEMVRLARALAVGDNARLIFLHTLRDSENRLLTAVPAGRDEDRRARNDAVRALIDGNIGSYRNWEVVIGVGDPAEEALVLIKETGVDLVMAASSGLSRLNRLLAGALVEKLARRLPCPLLVLPPAKRLGRKSPSQSRKTEVPGFATLAAALGDIEKDRSLITGASRLCGDALKTIYLVHCLEAPPDYEAEERESMSYEQYQQQRLAGMTESLGHYPSAGDIKIEPVLLMGSTGEEILAFGKSRDVDLLAVGVRPRGRLEKMLIGSTTETIIRGADRPVLLNPVGL